MHRTCTEDFGAKGPLGVIQIFSAISKTSIIGLQILWMTSEFAKYDGKIIRHFWEDLSLWSSSPILVNGVYNYYFLSTKLLNFQERNFCLNCTKFCQRPETDKTGDAFAFIRALKIPWMISIDWNCKVATENRWKRKSKKTQSSY